MPDEIKKNSNWVGSKRTDGERYIADLDRDVAKLYDEKSINITYLKRYAMATAITQG